VLPGLVDALLEAPEAVRRDDTTRVGLRRTAPDELDLGVRSATGDHEAEGDKGGARGETHTAFVAVRC
jgi:hypothetical protein